MKSKLASLILSALLCLILTGYEKGPELGLRARKNAEPKQSEAKRGKVNAKIVKATIATGGATGLYYPFGRLVSRIINSKSDEYKIDMQAKITKGSVYNIYSVMRGNAEFAMAQADSQYHALRGQKEWRRKGPQKDLRSICSLYPEVVTLVALQKSGIQQVKDMRGKRINFGLYGSGHLENAMDIINSSGINTRELRPQYFHTVSASRKLAQEMIDAFFYTVGHPNAEIKEVSYAKKVMIVPLESPEIEALINKLPYYTKAYINKRYYPYILNKEENIPSFAVEATLITSAKTNDEIVYFVTKEIFENINKLRSFHPVLSSLKKENMFKGLSAPLHQGAIKYYKEEGLAKFIDPALFQSREQAL